MRKNTAIAIAALLATSAILVGADALAAKQEIELADAEVIIEWNSTDTDFGIHFFWDGIGWEKMKVKNTKGKTVLAVKTSKNVKQQSLTEAFFESREPPASELSMQQFFDRFPEGDYEFVGKSFDGDKLVGEAEFSHALPEPSTILSPLADSTQSADGFTFEFTEVTEDIHGDPIDIEEYVIVLEPTGEEPAIDLEFTVPAGETSFFIPGQFITPNTTYKAEIIAQEEETGNRTITESGEFSVDGGS